MPSYDPQRNRPRQRPGADEPAPVDALLDAADVEPAARIEHAGADPGHPRHDHADHDHADHDHDHDHDLEDIALVPIVAVFGALAGVLVIVWRWRRRRAEQRKRD